MLHVPVLIVGGGPVGLALACELGWRDTGCLLVERNDGINAHPRANVVASRTMEHLRRWGIADRVARAGLPLDYPVEIVFTTRVAAGEIFRFSFPSYEQCEHPGAELLAAMPELRHSPYFKTSIGQNHFEPVLLEQAASFAGNSLRLGTRLQSFAQDADGVIATLVHERTGRIETVRADYLAACDGGRSPVRSEFAIGMQGQPDLGRFVGIYFRSSRFRNGHSLGRATLYWTMNPSATGTFIAIDGVDHFTFQRALRPGEEAEDIDPRTTIDEAFGAPLDAEIISVQPWRAHATVADRYRVGRVFLAGDAAHLFVPTGGFGMNTGIGDAVDLGWKLAARLAGWAGDGLLEAYEAERRPIGIRNTREAADNYLNLLPVFGEAARTELPDPAGAEARATIARRMSAERKHFAAIGIHLGARYDGSPIVVADDTPAPPDRPDTYVPTTRPGSRAPHAWLPDGRSTLDLVGRDHLLLCFGDVDPKPLVQAARSVGMPMDVCAIADPEVARLYERRLVLVRPDGHVAWRGDAAPAAAATVIDRIRGA